MKVMNALVSITLAGGLVVAIAAATGPASAQPEASTDAAASLPVVEALAQEAPQVVPQLPLPMAPKVPGEEPDPEYLDVCSGCEEAEWAIEAACLEADFPDVWAGRLGDWGENKVTYVQYNTKAAPERVAEFLARLEPLMNEDFATQIVARPVGFSQAEIDRHIDEIWADAEGFAKRLGITAICSSGPDYEKGVIELGTCDGLVPNSIPDVGFPVEVIAGGVAIPQ